jgi:3-oxoacyl-[acyl-carrier protein] reductase
MTAQRIAVVTGASRGIGLAIAKTLAAAGFGIVGTATGDTGLAALETELRDSRALQAAVQLDVMDPASITAFFARPGCAWAAAAGPDQQCRAHA